MLLKLYAPLAEKINKEKTKINQNIKIGSGFLIFHFEENNRTKKIRMENRSKNIYISLGMTISPYSFRGANSDVAPMYTVKNI
jgi:hypothetical protein